MRPRHEPQAPLEYALLSDVHLTEVLYDDDQEPGWWTYKWPDASQDEVLVQFLESVDAQRPERYRASVVVFNGDTFDFDSVYAVPEGHKPIPGGLYSDVPGSVFKLGRLLDCHPRFVAGLSAFLARGNRAIFVMGNHDRELHFPEVQTLFRERLAAAAPAGTGAQVATRIDFEPWFVHVPGVLFAEHGQQYDGTCAYRDVLHPVLRPGRTRGAEIDMSFGSHVGRQLLSRLGTFNPFDDTSFLLSLGGYVRHFLDFYWPRRPFFRPYILSSVTVLRDVRKQLRRAPGPVDTTSAPYRDYGRSQGVNAEFLGHLRRLWSTPIAERPGPLLHELWLDRMILFAVFLLISALGIANAASWSQALLLLTLVPVLIFTLRAMGRGSVALEERGRWGLVAEQIAGRLDVPVVAFGHSHRPERRPLLGGGRYYNLGTWAPIVGVSDGTPAARARRYLIVRPRKRGGVWVAFSQWEPPRTVSTKPPGSD